MGERGGSVFLRVGTQSGAAGEWPTRQGCPIFRPGGVSALAGLSQGPGAGKVHSSPTNSVAAMAPELCLTFWPLKAAELRTAKATHTRRKQRGFGSRRGCGSLLGSWQGQEDLGCLPPAGMQSSGLTSFPML